MEKVILDTNVLARFFLKDHLVLSPKAKKIFDLAADGKIDLYLDEVVISELVWLLVKYYGKSKKDVCEFLYKLFSHGIVMNDHKTVILKALYLFENNSLSYVDCWVGVLAKEENMVLETFDEKLRKIQK